MITENERAVRMLEDTPEYYHNSKVFNAIQQANAEELDLIDQKNMDLALQLDPKTATWGLKLWEERLGLFVDESGDLEERRKKVLARIRSGAPFSGAMVKAVVEAYTDRPVTIEFDKAAGQVNVIFDREFNARPELFAAIDNIIHAHLGVDYTAEWVYEGSLSYAWQYNTYNFPFKLFANNFLAGTQPTGANGVPSTLGRVITGAVEIAQTSYSTATKTFKYCGTFNSGAGVTN